MADAPKPTDAPRAATAPRAKSIDQLQSEYDAACKELQRASIAVQEEERKPRESAAHKAFATARDRKTAANAALAKARDEAGQP